ncbi:MAG: hypothetical protein AAF290_05165 [Pseudomonadota bacterium]
MKIRYLTALYLSLGVAMQPAAAEAPVLSEQLRACKGVSDSLQRLRCYDAIALDGDESMPAPAAVPSVAPVAAAPEPAPADPNEFGVESIREQRGPDEINSRIVNPFEGWGNNATFELENGQVWRQVDSAKYRYRGEEQPMATIKRKAFGAYRLTVEGTNRTVRVRRIQ